MLVRATTRRDFFKALAGKRTRGGALKPPGASQAFFELCNRCGDCLKACPYKSLVAGADGFPAIFPRRSPCYLCQDFPCIRACKPGALSLNGTPVRLGLAVLDKRNCLAWAGQDCQLCFIRCPRAGEAIYLVDLKPVVEARYCTGCGWCEQACATVNDRISIKVVPYT